jgi:hypothetical protein
VTAHNTKIISHPLKGLYHFGRSVAACDEPCVKFKCLPLLAVAACALSIGISVYLFFRDTRELYIIEAFHIPLISFRSLLPDNLKLVTASLPTATHAFALSLLTAPLLRSRRHPVGLACLLWACIDTAFEFLQLAHSCPSALSRSGDAFSAVACAYIANGTFAWLDVFSIWLGAAMAYWTLSWLVSESET